MHVELSSDASSFIDSLVSSGDFQTPSEAVAEGIRMLMSREKLRAEVQAGIDDLDAGRWVDGETMFAELREQNAKITPESHGE